jgi:hypothetical protein
VLINAFAVFAVANFVDHFSAERETQQGRNIADIGKVQTDLLDLLLIVLIFLRRNWACNILFGVPCRVSPNVPFPCFEITHSRANTANQ